MIQLPQPKYAAIVAVYVENNPSPIVITFTRIPDADVLADIKAIEKTPGFKVFENKPTLIHITVPLGYLKSEIGESIAKGLESHGLTVQRMHQVPLPTLDRHGQTHKMEEVKTF